MTLRIVVAWLSLSILLAISPSSSASVGGADRRQVLIVTLSGVSFEELMSAPAVRQLSRSGGSGLMTTKTADPRTVSAAYATLWAGRLVSSGTLPSLLYRTLRTREVPVCQNTANEELLAAVGRVRQLSGPSHSPSCFMGWRPHVRGGLAAIETVIGPTLECSDCGALPPPISEAERALRVRHEVAALSRSLSRVVHQLPAKLTLVIVVAPLPSDSMDGAGDEVTPLVMAQGMPDRLFPGNGPLHALTSGTTRQDGLVSNVDVAPTILEFLRVPIPSEMDGEPISVAAGPAPFALHRLHLEHRRSRIPVQLAELAFIVVTGLLAIGATAVASKRWTMDARRARWLRFVFLMASALLLVLLAGGRLPHLTYGYVLPFVAVAVVAIAAVSLAFGRQDPFGPFTFIGALGLAVLLFDAATGERAMRIPLYGGTMFDGARFYGLPNAFLPLLLASALFVARPLTPLQGSLLLAGAGLFAGFPSMGADIGGAITLFAAAGMWWVVRTRSRIRIKEVALVAGVTLAGLGLVLLANRYLPGAPTHATRFVERAGTGAGSVVETIRHRLGVGVHQMASEPATLIPLIGLAGVFVLVIKRAGLIDVAMGLDPRWRHLVVVMVLASAVAFVVNDTGASAAGPSFIYAMAGIAYPTMLVAEPRARTPSEASWTVEAGP